MSPSDSLRIGTPFVSPPLALFFLFLGLWSSYSQLRLVSQAEELPYHVHPSLLSRPHSSSLSSPNVLPSGGVQCVARPSGCSLSCPGGYEWKFNADGQLHCLCQCRLPIQTTNCQTYGLLFCRPDERCTTQNGQIKCVPTVPTTASNAAGQPSTATAAVFVSSPLQQMPYAVPPVNVVPLRPSLPIRPLGKQWQSEGNGQKYAGTATKGRTTAGGGGGRTEEGKAVGGDDDQCDGIICDESALHQCQLVESDCDSNTKEQPKMCPPVAKCLINPCPRGTPVRFPSSGVTALCRTDGQCLDGWCHKIGFNGFGFCCPLPLPSLIKKGQCEAKQTKKRTMAWEPRPNCSAECRSDSDCTSPLAKCCFDGCGMSCKLPGNGEENIGATPETAGGTEEARQTPRGNAREGDGTIGRQGPPKRGEKPSAECPSLRDRPSFKCEEEADSECSEDANCAGGAKCCWDGCSLRCSTAEDNGTVLTLSEQCPQWPVSHRTQFCLEERKGEENGRDECQMDGHCPNDQKCCVGPCDRRQCFYPSLDGTSECVAQIIAARILAEINAENKRIFVPKCDAKGQFATEQSDGQFKFCVDQRGNELAGSRRLSDQFVDCDQKQNCPSVQCHLKCPFGFQPDSVGCPQCRCRASPCHAVHCPIGFVCRIVPHHCPSSPPSLVPSSCAVSECLPNVCPTGEPLEDTRNGRLIQCEQRDGAKCPPGWHCHQMGIGTMGFCCPGMMLQSELLPSSNLCPAVPNLSYKWRNAGTVFGCRLSRECHSQQICCFDGASTQCLALSEMERSSTGANGVQTTQKIARHLAQCPLRLLNASSADCASNCASDADCARRSPFLRCCAVGCGAQCHFGDKLTPCVHLLATNLREVDKLVEVPKSFGRPTVQCTAEGLFEEVQFDPANGQFWCVDALTGIESVGSRVSASPLGPLSPPDCNVRHFCKFNCSTTASSKECPHGLRMDHRGCPLTEQCQCRSPCEEFKCSFPNSEICLLKVVECVDGSFCPPIPICVANVCGRFGLQSVGDFVCSTSSDCQIQLANTDRIIECKFGLSNFPFDRIGICCASSTDHLFKEQSFSSDRSSVDANAEPFKEKASFKIEGMDSKEGKQKQNKQGICPAEGAGSATEGDCSDLCSTDTDCAGIQKCCRKSAGGCRQCVQPILATNCMNLLSAVLSLDAAQTQHSVPRPNCDSKTGAFSRVQCDGLGWCWCVQSASSASPLLGTRFFQPTDGEMFCETPKVCPLRQCSAVFCPFGVEFDSDGCPLSSECRCRSICDQIKCPDGQICLLRARDCLELEKFPPDLIGQASSSICLPVPICEPSPCGGIRKPLLNSALLVPQNCQLNNANRPLSLPQCPTAFQCIRQREFYSSVGTTPEGICCPLEANDGDGDGQSVFREQQQIRENGREKAFFCHLPSHQGNGAEECGEGRSELRYFYDSLRDRCEAFLFAGCGGNANNFKSKSECEKKCKVSENLRENVTESFKIGVVFSANGPLSGTIERSLRDYLQRAFDLTESQIRKIRVDGPTKGQVQFTIAAPDARQKAKQIAEMLALGQFQFPLDDGNSVRALSEGWWTKRAMDGWEEEEGEEEEEADKAVRMQTAHIPLFWVLFLPVAIFAVVVLFVPCCAFAFLRARPPRVAFGRNSPPEGEDGFSTPSPRVRALTRHNWGLTANQRKDAISATPTVLMEEAEERVHALRMRTSALINGAIPLAHSAHSDHLPFSPPVLPSSPSPAASSNASIHFANRQQRIIAPRILAEEGGEEERIRRGKSTSTRTTWRWRT